MSAPFEDVIDACSKRSCFEFERKRDTSRLRPFPPCVDGMGDVAPGNGDGNLKLWMSADGGTGVGDLRGSSSDVWVTCTTVWLAVVCPAVEVAGELGRASMLYGVTSSPLGMEGLVFNLSRSFLILRLSFELSFSPATGDGETGLVKDVEEGDVANDTASTLAGDARG